MDGFESRMKFGAVKQINQTLSPPLITTVRPALIDRISAQMKSASICPLVLLLVFLLGAMLRYIALSDTQVNTPVRADAAKYLLYAYNLKNFGLYSYSAIGAQGQPEQLQPDALVTPGYPLLVSMFVNADGFLNYTWLLAAQALLSALTIILAYFLFLGLGRGWAVLVAFLTACSPHLVSMNTYLLTETLFCFFLVAFLALASRLLQARLWLFGLAGGLLGLATLTRPWIQGFLPVLCIFLFATANRHSRIRPLLLLAGFALVVAPWLIRNYLLLGSITDPTLSIASIYHGMYPDMMYNFQPQTTGFAYRFDPWIETVQLTSQTLFDELSRRVAEQPWTYIQWYLWGKLLTVFSWDIIAGAGDVFVYPVIQTPYTYNLWLKTTHALMHITHPVLVLLCLMSAVAAWLPASRQMPSAFLFTLRLLSLLIFYFILMHTIGAPYPRYSIPMRPVMYGMAVAVPVWCIHYFRHYFRHVSNCYSDSRV